jgi:hypothetical protein
MPSNSVYCCHAIRNYHLLCCYQLITNVNKGRLASLTLLHTYMTIFLIAGVLDFIHRPDLIVTIIKKNKHDVSETGSVSVLR